MNNVGFIFWNLKRLLKYFARQKSKRIKNNIENILYFLRQFKRHESLIQKDKGDLVNRMRIMLLLLLAILVVNIVITEFAKITPTERINTDSARLVNAVESYYYKKKQLPKDFTEIRIFEEIIHKYVIDITRVVDNDQITIVIFWPEHMLKSIINIDTRSEIFIYKNRIFFVKTNNNLTTK